jgi:hypothetical protein
VKQARSVRRHRRSLKSKPSGHVRVLRRIHVGALALGGLLLASSAQAATTGTNTYTTPGVHSFTVPAGVTSVEASLQAGAGGGGCFSSPGGAGAALTATFAVTPGESLSIGVAGDGTCAFGSGVGGAGGGGAGGGLAGGGGGASSLLASNQAPGFSSLLAIAGGGGGSGAFGGGDAGSAGTPNGPVEGGGAGAQTSGGAGGAGFPCGETGTNGANGVAFGGGGGGVSGSSFGGGGGGGGGYYGGGGGGGVGCAAAGGSGGGGSSFIDPLATVSSEPTPTSAAPFVSITYAAPTAETGTSSLIFPSQPQGTASAAQTVTVTNNGSAPLTVSSATASGTNPEDYLVTSQCHAPVETGQSCGIAVRFDPHEAGASSASLTLETNTAAQPLPIELSGTGGALPTGPTGPAGETGETGPQGETGAQGEAGLQGQSGAPGASGDSGAAGLQGSTGPAGLSGRTGPAGPRGATGATAVYECHRRKHGRRPVVCFVRVLTSRKASKSAPVHATLTRRGTVYASWSGRLGAGWSELQMPAARQPQRGTYTLTLAYRHAGRSVLSHQAVVID